MYGTDGWLIYAPRGASCSDQKGGNAPGPAAAYPAVTRGCDKGNCKEGEGPCVWPNLSRPAAKVGGGEKDVAVIVEIEHDARVSEIPGAAENAADSRISFPLLATPFAAPRGVRR